MTKGRMPHETPEGWERDDLSRMRRVHDALDLEYHQIPEGTCRHRYGGSVPIVRERPGDGTS